MTILLALSMTGCCAALVEILLQLGEFVDETCVSDIDLRIADFFHVGFFILKCCFVYSSRKSIMVFIYSFAFCCFPASKFISFSNHILCCSSMTDAYGQVRSPYYCHVNPPFGISNMLMNNCSYLLNLRRHF